MDRFSLGDAAFAALAAGRPSAATVHTLRRAQLGKHLLLLREIARADPDLWYAAERANPSGFRRRVADPLFGAWAAHRLRSGAEQAGDQPLVPGGRWLVAEQAGDQPLIPGGRWLVAEHDGLAVRVRLEDTDPARGLLGLTPTGRLTDDAAGHWHHCLAEAWQILVSRHRPAAEVLAGVLRCLIPVEPDRVARGISATSADAFGAVAMSAPKCGSSLALGLVHEVQHSLLNATAHLFDLHVTPGTLGYSPWRDDPRPASGLLHGAYAYLAVTRFWRVEAAVTGDRMAAFEFARWRDAVADAADRLLEPASRTASRTGSTPGQNETTGGLTAAGRRFVGALREEVGTWLTEPVDREVARLATAANADHHVRWRLRNLAVDPGDAEKLALAWRAGQAAPAVASRLVTGTGRALESSARLDLIHRTVKGDPAPHAGGRATAGDVAFSRGDYGTAEAAYRERVLLDPQDDAAWSGLALVTGRGDRLELVKAAFARTGADPIALCDWFGRR